MTRSPDHAEREAILGPLKAEIERQCSIGAGTFTVDDGYGQSGLWEMTVALDPNSLAAVLHAALHDAAHLQQNGEGVGNG